MKTEDFIKLFKLEEYYQKHKKFSLIYCTPDRCDNFSITFIRYKEELSLNIKADNKKLTMNFNLSEENVKVVKEKFDNSLFPLIELTNNSIENDVIFISGVIYDVLIKKDMVGKHFTSY